MTGRLHSRAPGKRRMEDEAIEITSGDEDEPALARRHKRVAVAANSYENPIDLDDEDEPAAKMNADPFQLLAHLKHDPLAELLGQDLDMEAEIQALQDTYEGNDLDADLRRYHMDVDVDSIVPEFIDFNDYGLPPLDPAGACLQRCLEIFPDISHEHVRMLHDKLDRSVQQVLEQILEAGSYPKEKDSQAAQMETRQKAASTENDDQWMQQNRDVNRAAIVDLIKQEFLDIPVTYIHRMQAVHIHLYPAYLAIEQSRREKQLPYRRVIPRKPAHSILEHLRLRFGDSIGLLEKEMLAARRACQKMEIERDNLKRSKETNSMGDCAVCFEELPFNRMIQCAGDVAHYSCFECMTTFIKTEIGQMQCNVVCPHGDDQGNCEKPYTTAQLNLLPEKQLVDKLSKLCQQRDILAAGLGGLEECPFCDYKAIYPPIEENFEFQCDNEECGIRSCRKCKHKTHVPMSCEEFALARSKDVILTKRHAIEEAMTGALVRNCNRCKKPFVKELGCNKMTCGCGNTQCYCCGADVKGNYTHFDAGSCPLHDDSHKRHEDEVKAAEATARTKVQQDHPHISAADLEIKVSDRIKFDQKAASTKRKPLQYDPMHLAGYRNMPAHAQGLARGAQPLPALHDLFVGAPGIPPIGQRPADAGQVQHGNHHWIPFPLHAAINGRGYGFVAHPGQGAPPALTYAPNGGPPDFLGFAEQMHFLEPAGLQMLRERHQGNLQPPHQAALGLNHAAIANAVQHEPNIGAQPHQHGAAPTVPLGHPYLVPNPHVRNPNDYAPAVGVAPAPPFVPPFQGWEVGLRGRAAYIPGQLMGDDL